MHQDPGGNTGGVATRSSDPKTTSIVGVAAATCIGLVIGGPALPPLVSVTLIVAGTASCLLIAAGERRGHGTSARTVVVAVAAVLVVAVAVVPRGSQDLWLYVMYGRELAVHHASPYAHVPADFAADPFLAHVGLGWRHTASIYGPAFVGYSSLGALVAGNHVVVARLFHQLLAAGALAGILAVVWRRTRSPAALALIGLHPAVAVAAVNGGHSDLLVGLLILIGTLLASDGRPVAAGLVLSGAVLVKVTAGLALIGIVVWLVSRRDLRAAARLLLPAAAVSVAAYAVAGPAAIGALRAGANVGVVSRASVWQVPLRAALDLHPSDGAGALTMVATTTVLTLGAVLAWRVAHRAGPDKAALLATAAYPVASSYTLPWYMAWSLPLAALRPHSRLTTLLVLQAGFLAAAYDLPRGIPPVHWMPDDHLLVAYVLPVGILVAFVAIALTIRDLKPGLRSTGAAA